MHRSKHLAIGVEWAQEPVIGLGYEGHPVPSPVLIGFRANSAVGSRVEPHIRPSQAKDRRDSGTPSDGRQVNLRDAERLRLDPAIQAMGLVHSIRPRSVTDEQR